VTGYVHFSQLQAGDPVMTQVRLLACQLSMFLTVGSCQSEKAPQTPKRFSNLLFQDLSQLPRSRIDGSRIDGSRMTLVPLTTRQAIVFGLPDGVFSLRS